MYQHAAAAAYGQAAGYDPRYQYAVAPSGHAVAAVMPGTVQPVWAVPPR